MPAEAAAPRLSLISPTTERCTALRALSIFESRASISCSLPDSISLAVTAYDKHEASKGEVTVLAFSRF